MFQMNFEQINRGSEERDLMKIANLDKKKFYKIEDVRKVKTVYGLKVIVDMEGCIYSFLPNKTIEKLFENNDKEYEGMRKQIQNAELYMKGINKNSVKFYPNKVQEGKEEKMI